MTFLPKITTWVICLTLALAGVGLALHPGQGQEWSYYVDAWLVNIVRFSIWQALLSAFFSTLFAIPIALVLARRVFHGQWLVKGLLNLFFIMPVLTIVLGVVTAYDGWFNVFSLKGIVVAHCYLNLPYAIRIFWERLSRISPIQYQLANTLNFNAWQRFRWLQWPVIREALRPVFVLIFLLCFSSFTVVLTMGGGPANTNLEVAIYQALKFDFDPKAAVIYAAIHGLIAFSVMWFLGKRQGFSLEVNRHQAESAQKISIGQAILVLCLLLVLFYPLWSLILHALSQPFSGSTRLWLAIKTSLVIALGSSFVAVLLALLRSLNKRQGRMSRFLDFGLLVLPMMVITTGLFLLALRFGMAFKITYGLIIWLNGLMAMPLILGPMQSRIASYRAQYQRLFASLDFSLWAQLRWVYFPAVVHVLPWSITLAIVLSLGDLGVAALLGSAQFVTLPILIYQAMGSYQMVLASQLTLILLLVCFILLLMAEWLGDRSRYAQR